TLLQRPIDSRLQQLKTLKHQRDFEKLQSNQHDTAVQSQSRLAMQEQAKKEQLAGLMKEYNTLFKQAKYKEAEAVATRAADLDPDDPVARAAIYTARIQANQVSYSTAKERRERMTVDALNQAEDPGPDVNSDHPLLLN